MALPQLLHVLFLGLTFPRHVNEAGLVERLALNFSVVPVKFNVHLVNILLTQAVLEKLEEHLLIVPHVSELLSILVCADGLRDILF